MFGAFASEAASAPRMRAAGPAEMQPPGAVEVYAMMAPCQKENALPIFAPGVAVRLCDLKSAAHLNGDRGRLVEEGLEAGRWKVALVEGPLAGQTKALKAKNLRVLRPDEDPGPEPSGVSLAFAPPPSSPVEPQVDVVSPARIAEAIAGLEGCALELDALDEDLRCCREVVLAAVRIDGFALEYAAERLKEDRDVVLAAVFESGLALRHAGLAARADREVVLAAVLETAAALEFADATLRADQDTVLTAVSSDPEAVRFVALELLDQASFVTKAAQAASKTFSYASERLKSDPDTVLRVVAVNPDAFMHASPELRGDRAFVLRVVERSGLAIAHATPALKTDPEVYGAAVQNDPMAAAAARA